MIRSYNSRDLRTVALFVLVGQLTIFQLQVNAVSIERRTTSNAELQRLSQPKEDLCTPVDHTVQEIPDKLKCLENYTRSDKTTCPKKSQKTEVFGYSWNGTTCKIWPDDKKPLHAHPPLCYIEGGLDGSTYEDQKVANSFTGPCTATISPSQALRNAKPAIDNRMNYAECDKHGTWQGFPMTAPGFIARAWNLKLEESHLKLKVFQFIQMLQHENTTKQIDCWDALPGDIITVGIAHVALIHHWKKDQIESGWVTWEAKSVIEGHVEGFYSVKDLQTGKGWRHQYKCWRYNCMSKAVEVKPPSLLNRIKHGIQGFFGGKRATL